MTYPIKISWKTEIIPLAIIAGVTAASFYFYSHFPAVVATHWNFQGEADGFGGKTLAAFLLPGLVIFIYALLLALPLLDPKRERYGEFANAYHAFRYLILGVLAIVYLAASLYNLGWAINTGIVTATAIGLMLMAMGHYLKQIKMNWFFGIRTPWTLSSDKVWDETHRVGGTLFMIFGLLMIAMPFLPEALAITIFCLWLVIMIFGTIGYSYWLHRQETMNQKQS